MMQPRRIALFLCAATLWLVSTAVAVAGEGWLRLPEALEIEAARTQLAQTYSFAHPNCASTCSAQATEVARQICLARACMDACRLGPEIRKSESGVIELVKAHNPQIPEPPQSGMVFALTTTRRVVDDCKGNVSEQTEYGIEMLQFRESGWYFVGNRLAGGVRQQDRFSQAQRDAEFASYFGPGKLTRGFPWELNLVLPEPVASHRINVHRPDARRPLWLVLEVEQLQSKSATGDSQYRPAPGLRVEVDTSHITGAARRLAPYFESAACQNCERSEQNGRSMDRLRDPSQPIVLLTDAGGKAQIEFLLDFGALSELGELRPGGTIHVPLQLTAYAAVGREPARVVAQKAHVLDIAGIGIVEAITYEPPQRFHPLSGSALPRGLETALSNFSDDAGTADGPRTLTGRERVLVHSRGAASIGASGTTPGRTLDDQHVLQMADQITVNACGLVSNRIVDGLPAGAPGQIWVRLRFFDGLRGKFGVNGSVCRAALRIGGSGAESGFTSNPRRFVYWAAEQGVDAVVSLAFAPYAVLDDVSDVYGWLKWAMGHEAVYVVLQSALSVEFDAGQMHISTREGSPRVITAQTSTAGMKVPVGQTAAIAPGQQPVLRITERARARKADAQLAVVQGIIPLEVESATPEPDPLAAALLALEAAAARHEQAFLTYTRIAVGEATGDIELAKQEYAAAIVAHKAAEQRVEALREQQ